jgi:phosphinothricin acetyltransferase
MQITVEILKRATLKDLENINSLVPQIAKKPHLLSMSDLRRVMSQTHNCKVVVARAHVGRDKPIVGMAVVTLMHIPTGPIAVVEDVVVDENWRGLGIGKMLNQKLIDIAAKAKVKHISLHTNQKRIIANEMYKTIGYEQLEGINFYRINFSFFAPSDSRDVANALSKRIKRS